MSRRKTMSNEQVEVFNRIRVKAKDFANEITSFNIRKRDLKSECQITNEHVKNDQDVRKMLAKCRIVPEKLPKR